MSVPKNNVRPPLKSGTPIRVRSGSVAGICLLAALPCPPALAQLRPIEASLQTTVTATNNGAGAPAGQEQSDAILVVQPRVRLERRSAGLSVSGDAGVSLVSSANNTRRSRALPEAGLIADASLVDRLLNLEGAVDVRQVEQDPFATRVDPNSPDNALTSATYRLSPVLRHEFSPRLSLVARDDETWTRYSGEQGNDNRSRATSARLLSKPQPLGGSLEAVEQRVTYAQGADADWRSRSILATVNYAYANEWVVGVVAGSERSTFALSSQTDTRAGLRLFWSPGPRTEMIAAADRRYFGSGWEFRLRHRTPATALLLRAVREPTAGNLVGGIASGSRLEDFFGAILTTRLPDPQQRAAAVVDLMATRGLQDALPGVAGITANYPQRRTGGEVTWVMLGTRHTVTLTAFAQSLSQLTLKDGSALVAVPADADNRQAGGSLGLNRRLSPVMSIDGLGRWSRIQGYGSHAGEKTRETLYRLTVVRNLSPHTGVSLGVLRRSIDTQSATADSYKETAGFVGMNHRF